MGQALATFPPETSTSFAALMSKNWGPNAQPKTAALKNFNIVAGETYTLFQYNGGPGVISSVFTQLPPFGSGTVTQNGMNGVLSFYVDSETTPSMTYDIGGPMVWFAPNNSFRAAANINGGTVSFGASNTAFQSTFTNKYFPIPWHSNILVTFTATVSGNGIQNLALNYVLGVYFPFKLCSSCLTYDQAVGVNGSSQYNLDGITGSGAVQFLNVQGQSEYLVYSSLAVSSANNANPSMFEQNLGLYLDGNAPATSLTQANHSLTTVGGTPDLDSSGSEDFYRTAFFGQTGAGGSQCFICTYDTGHPSSNELSHYTFDIMELDGGWRFHTSIVLQWETGRRGINQNNFITNTAFTPFWCNFYYIDYL